MRWPNLLVPGLAVVLIATCLVTGATIATRTQTPTETPASVAPLPHDSGTTASCKPRLPVVVELTQREDASWHVVVEAHETTAGVQVRIGTGDAGHNGRILWTGDLQAGERRTFDARMDAGVLDAWATCEIRSPAGTTLRSVAVAPGTASKSRRLAAAETGRIVVDPNTGAGVFEYRGQVEAAR